MEITIVLIVVVLAMVLFGFEWLRVDITAVLVLLCITLFGVISFDQAFQGFSNPAVITVLGMFVLGGALVRTGIAAWIAQLLLELAGRNDKRILLFMMISVGFMSAFMNNIGAVAILMPAVLSMSRKRSIPPTKLLMPLAFASLLGGLTTLIGTPPNILVSGILVANGFEGFSMFSYFPTGIVVLLAGIVYFLTIGQRLLPERGTRQDIVEGYDVEAYLSEVLVAPESPLIGQTLREAGLGSEYSITVLSVIRGKQYLSAHDMTELRENDILLVEASLEDLMSVKTTRGIEIRADVTLEDLRPSWLELAEAAIAPRSSFINQSIKELDFRRRYGLNVIAIRRHDRALSEKIGDLRLEFGDVLLLQGRKERIQELRKTREFLLLESVDNPIPRTDKAVFALVIMSLTVAMAALSLLHVSVAAILGATLMILFGCITVEEAYEAIEWRAVVLIGAMLPLGTAMEVSGAATLLAGGVIDALGALGPMAVMAGIYLITSIITQVMSNAAAAVLIAPLAISVAVQMDISPYPLMMAIAISASSAFVTPIGHQASVLIYSVGNYRFSDFAKVGLPLALLIFIVALITIPLVWPF